MHKLLHIYTLEMSDGEIKTQKMQLKINKKNYYEYIE